MDASLTFHKNIDISKLTIRRLVNLVEYMIKNNAEDENEKSLIMERLYELPEELVDQTKKSTKRKRRSGKEKIAAYVEKHQKGRSAESQENTEKNVKILPAGFGMSKEEAQSMMDAMREEDRELIRGER